MKESKSISLFTLLFWSIFINSKKFLIITLISLVIIFTIFFSAFYPKVNLKIGVVNLDKGITLQFSSQVLSFSNQITENLKKQGNQLIIFKSLDNAIQYLNNGKISLILYFPENYTLFTHLANFSKSSNVKPRILIYSNEIKFAKEIKLELFNAFTQMVETKIIPLEIVETITNKVLPSSYSILSGLIIFIFIFSLLSSYNFGNYLLTKEYDQFLKVINQSFLPVIVILSFLISLAFFILNSLALTFYSLITKNIPFFGYAYLPINIFLLSFNASILGYIISYLTKKHNIFVILAFILFFIHFLTFPLIDNNTIFSIILSYIFPSIQLEKIWYWILSLNISPIKSFYISILYSAIYVIILIMVFLIEKFFKNRLI